MGANPPPTSGPPPSEWQMIKIIALLFICGAIFVCILNLSGRG